MNNDGSVSVICRYYDGNKCSIYPKINNICFILRCRQISVSWTYFLINSKHLKEVKEINDFKNLYSWRNDGNINLSIISDKTS